MHLIASDKDASYRACSGANSTSTHAAVARSRVRLSELNVERARREHAGGDFDERWRLALTASLSVTRRSLIGEGAFVPPPYVALSESQRSQTT